MMLLVVLDLAIMPATADEHETGEDKYHASVDNAMDAYNAAIKRAFDKHLRTLGVPPFLVPGAMRVWVG